MYDALELTKLNINPQRIKSKEAIELADAIKRNTKLLELSILFNLIGVAGVTAITKAINHTNILKKLEITVENKIEVEVIANALKTNTSITNIMIHTYSFKNTCIIALGKALLFNQNLTKLRIWYNEISSESIKLLAIAIKTNKILKFLQIEGHIKTNGTNLLAKSLKHNSTLEHFGLEYGKVDQEAANNFYESLKNNKTLTTLKLTRCCINDIGAGKLSRLLTENSYLKNLYLNGNEIGNAGIIAIAKALKINESFLNLYTNKFNNDGATAMADALKVNKHLEYLELSCNKFDKKGVIAIAKAVKDNKSLIDLGLCYKDYTKDTLNTIHNICKNNQIIEIIYFGDGRITNYSVKRTRTEIKKNADTFTLLLKKDAIPYLPPEILVEILINTGDPKTNEGVRRKIAEKALANPFAKRPSLF